MCKRTRSTSPKKKRLPDDPFIQDYVEFFEGMLYYKVYDTNSIPLFQIPHRILQKLTRDILTGLLTRWDEIKPCGSLLPGGVEVRDHTALLPLVGSPLEDMDYQGRFKEMVEGVFGFDGEIEGRDSFYTLLSKPLNRKQFGDLYYHVFLQNEEERADFPSEVVENVRDRKVLYNSIWLSFEDAYICWEADTYNKKFNLSHVSRKNYWFSLVYNFRTYKNTALEEAKLVRNAIKHLNQHRRNTKSRRRYMYSKRRIGAVVYEVVPDIIPKLYRFMWDCQVDMDFKKSILQFP